MATFTDDYSEMQEFAMPGDGEIIVAMHTMDMRNKEEMFICYDCAVKNIMPLGGTQENFAAIIENQQYLTGVMHEFLTTKYDELWSENGDVFLGKICQECKCALGGWHVCKFCDGVEFPNEDNPHNCMEFTNPRDSE